MLLPAAAMAQESGGPVFGPTLDLGYDFGGAKLATVIFTNGDHENIRAGQGIDFAVGGHIMPSRDSRFDLRANVGYKYQGVSADNADIYLDRMTWEVMPNYRFTDHLSFGAGAIGNFNIKFHEDQFGPTVKLKPATGAGFRLAWMNSSSQFYGIGLALTYNLLRYHYTDTNGAEQGLNANSIGIRAIFNFNVCCNRAPARRSPEPMPVAQQVYTPVAPATQVNPVTPITPLPAPIVTPAPIEGTAAYAKAGAQLRNQPTLHAQSAQPLPEGTAIRLISPMQNVGGAWWYVKTADGKDGWLLQNEIKPVTP
ncbi:MAG: hypothetical protein ACRETM_02770 [Stenotrophobium sp.]